MIFITRRKRFNAAHRLYRKDWSDEQNTAVFGKCANPNWHGHNYELFVTVKGNINPETGYLLDLKQLSELLENKIVNHIDHKNINLEVPFMQGKLASTENLAVAIWDEISHDIQQLGAELHCIKVQETENNSVSFYGHE